MIPARADTTNDANSIFVFIWYEDIKILKPIPVSEPANSATIAPIILNVDDILKAEKRNGSDDGNLSFTNTWYFEPDRDFIKSNASLLTDLKPIVAFTVAGKKQINTAMVTFPKRPLPNQIVKRGAMAMIGIACEPTIYG